VAEVEGLKGQGCSLKEALGVAGLSKSRYYYRPKPRSPRPLNSALREALEAITGRELVYGYRKKTHYLRYQGLWCNALRRLYREDEGVLRWILRGLSYRVCEGGTGSFWSFLLRDVSTLSP